MYSAPQKPCRALCSLDLAHGSQWVWPLSEARGHGVVCRTVADD